MISTRLHRAPFLCLHRILRTICKGPEMKVPDVVASFRERYTAVKRLTLYPASGPHTENIKTWEGVRATVQFIGPQPSQGPGSLLCQLLAGTSVEAEPIILGRGRKKRPRSECESSEASDYGELGGQALNFRRGHGGGDDSTRSVRSYDINIPTHVSRRHVCP